MGLGKLHKLLVKNQSCVNLGYNVMRGDRLIMVSDFNSSWFLKDWYLMVICERLSLHNKWNSFKIS